MKSWQVRIYFDNLDPQKPRENRVSHVASVSPVLAAAAVFNLLDAADRERLYEIDVAKNHDLAAVLSANG